MNIDDALGMMRFIAWMRATTANTAFDTVTTCRPTECRRQLL